MQQDLAPQALLELSQQIANLRQLLTAAPSGEDPVAVLGRALQELTDAVHAQSATIESLRDEVTALVAALEHS